MMLHDWFRAVRYCKLRLLCTASLRQGQQMGMTRQCISDQPLQKQTELPLLILKGQKQSSVTVLLCILYPAYLYLCMFPTVQKAKVMCSYTIVPASCHPKE